MEESAKADMRNVLVVAAADGKLADEEKQLIQELRRRLGIGDEEFAELCEQVRRDPKKLTVSQDVEEATETFRLMAAMAAADGEIQPAERNLLHRLAEYVGLDSQQAGQIVDEALGVDEAAQARVESAIEEVYASFESWDSATRREKIGALTSASRGAVVPLLRALESYRTPAGASDALAMKTMLTRAIGDIGDERAVYYLVQQVNIGDIDDEVTCAALRYAAAEAVGKILGKPFAADQEGVKAVRQWWQSQQSRRYDRLAF